MSKDNTELGLFERKKLPQHVKVGEYSHVTQYFDIYKIEYIDDVSALKEEESTHLSSRRLISHEPDDLQRMRLEKLINDFDLYNNVNFKLNTKYSTIQFLEMCVNNDFRTTVLEERMIEFYLNDNEKKEYEELVGFDFCSDDFRKKFWDDIDAIRRTKFYNKKKKNIMTERDIKRIEEEIRLLEELNNDYMDEEEKEFFFNLLTNT
jgi:hypothetical protein